MSTPNLRLCLGKTELLPAIGNFLGLDLSRYRTVVRTIGVREFEKADLGGISLRDVSGLPIEYGNYYGENWKLAVSFDCISKWTEIRMLIVLKIVEWLELSAGDMALGYFDTGTTLFFCSGKNCIVNRIYEKELCRESFLDLKLSFADLPTV